MKLFRTTVLVVLLVLTGCIGENRDLCPTDNNLTLRFSYTLEQGSNIFRERMTQTDLFIFDQAGSFVQRQTIGADQLDANHSINLTLAPGNYRLICWGNLLNQTDLSPLNKGANLQEAYIYTTTLQQGMATTCDPWYYAPRETAEQGTGYLLNVPTSGNTTHTLHFTSAYTQLQLFIEGFKDPDGAGGNLPPLIEVESIVTKLDFNKQPLGSVATYKQATTYQTIEGNNLATAYFNLPLFKNDNPVKIHIKRASDGTTVTTISLKEYMANNGLTVENREEPRIPIQIAYSSTQEVAVSITLPKWEESSVTPDL